MVNYAEAYNDYWSRPERIGSASGDLHRVAELVVQSCGFGRTLDVGCGEGALVGALLAQGVDAHGVDVSEVVLRRCLARYPGRFRVGSILALPFADGEFVTVVSTDCLEHLAADDIPLALAELKRVARRFVFLQIATAQDRDDHWHLTVEGRDWWEERCLEAGFRLHPLSWHLVPYEARENEGAAVTIALEKIPLAAEAVWSREELANNRLLHMDMLRESGRRGDAHCVRYHLAAQYIRPGDRVLDVACGLGYGSHILYQNSQAASVLGVDASAAAIAYARAHYGMDKFIHFRAGDAQSLAFLPDHCVDFITSFETIEHLPDPAAYLAELKRVLRPAGRLIISAPHDWTDESGRDPNPHHFHVYSWQRLLAECGASFLPEKGFVQTAGGAMKCHGAPRRWLEVPLTSALQREAEWIVLLCMADPAAGRTVPYRETSWELPSDGDFNVSAFARDYRNPWLVKGMVALGMRSQSAALLQKMQESVLQDAPADSVDYGAALCGRAYALLDGAAAAEEYGRILGQIRAYAELREPQPHQLRWQISLLFAGAELARRRGDFGEAVALYTACAAKDPLPYSPLLGNKTLDALFWLTLLALQRGEREAAREYLRRSVREVQRLASGSWLNVIGAVERPLPFGFPEMAQLLDRGSRAVYLLRALDSEEQRPGHFGREAKGFYERLLDWKDKDLRTLRQGTEILRHEIGRLTAETETLAQEVVRQEAHAQELAREVIRQDAHAQELAREVVRQDAHAQELAREIVRQSSAPPERRQNAGARSLGRRLFRLFTPD